MTPSLIEGKCRTCYKDPVKREKCNLCRIVYMNTAQMTDLAVRSDEQMVRSFSTFKKHPQGPLQMKSNIFSKINVKSALFGVDRKQIKLMYFSQLGFYD